MTAAVSSSFLVSLPFECLGLAAAAEEAAEVDTTVTAAAVVVSTAAAAAVVVTLLVFELVFDDDDCFGRLFFFEKDESVEDQDMRLADRALLGVDEKEEPLSGLVFRFELFLLLLPDDFLEAGSV